MFVNKYNLTFAIKIAEINLNKLDYYSPGPFHKIITSLRNATCFYYSDDGNTKVIKDCYNEFLKEMHIKPFYKLMQKEFNFSENKNIKIKYLLNLLKPMLNDPKVENLRVLHYGY